MKFGERLRELRNEKNLTQKQLGDIFNVNRVTIVDWEIRGKQPSYEILCKLAKFFEVRTDYLLGLED
ncbi:MAG: helix-turn-helix domain-containing protein [Firmicutes bacterium]|nr:helix-turn-helix domain-containing protein [Bacillota bacterium]